MAKKSSKFSSSEYSTFHRSIGDPFLMQNLDKITYGFHNGLCKIVSITEEKYESMSIEEFKDKYKTQYKSLNSFCKKMRCDFILESAYTPHKILSFDQNQNPDFELYELIDEDIFVEYRYKGKIIRPAAIIVAKEKGRYLPPKGKEKNVLIEIEKLLGCKSYYVEYRIPHKTFEGDFGGVQYEILFDQKESFSFDVTRLNDGDSVKDISYSGFVEWIRGL